MSATNPKHFDSFASEYDVITGINSDFNFFLERVPSTTRRALDVGCGTGHLAMELAKHFDEVTGIDLSASMLEIAENARGGSNISYRQGNVDSLEIDGPFDLICSSTTFHHLPDPGRTAKRLSDLLSPGGVLAIVDCVQRGPRLPNGIFRQFLRIEALIMRIRDARRDGKEIAARNYRARSNPDWIEHLVHDRFLTPSQFQEIFGSALPGAEFTTLGWFDGVSWRRPA